ncbi:MAG: trypsin-like peptidase domain-containing protein [Acidobacteria bacterium]|nr:trypsin-like peptidase domain-containing protein [Acidobacteriota bacterium]
MLRWIALVSAATVLALGVSPGIVLAQEAPPGIETAVVRIVTFSQRGDAYSPWNAAGVMRGAGSGVVVGGGLVLTNAHVVSDARMVVLFLHGDPNPHEARVAVAGHDGDLALVVPLEQGLLDHIAPLAIGGLPALRSVVETYGYPTGGEQISSTRGVVSRIDMQLYVHSGVDAHLAVQTDAAINPGNSGGAVVQDGKLVGIAFQNSTDLENVGFFIPTEVVRHFLEDAADGVYGGYPELGAETATMVNPAARRKAGMGELSGVRVDRVLPGSSADGLLAPGDILLAIEGSPLANDGTVATDGLRVRFGALVDRHQVGTSLAVEVLRDGKRVPLSIPLRTYPPVARLANAYDRLPQYYVYGGLVFVPLDREMLKTYGNDWPRVADRPLLRELLLRGAEESERMQEERVVLLRRLDHPVNADFAWYRNEVVERINGRTIRTLADVIAAIEENKEPQHVFELKYYGKLAALDRAAADAANAQILEQYGIPKDRRP